MSHLLLLHLHKLCMVGVSGVSALCTVAVSVLAHPPSSAVVVSLLTALTVAHSPLAVSVSLASTAVVSVVASTAASPWATSLLESVVVLSMNKFLFKVPL